MRDYFKEPLKRGELIPYNDLYEVYINRNLGGEATAKQFNTTRTVIKRHLKVYNLKKPKNAVYQRVSETFAEHFIPLPYEELYDYYIVNHNSRQDCMKHFKVSLYNLNKSLDFWSLAKNDTEVNLQRQITCLKHLGVSNPNKSAKIITKRKATIKQNQTVPLEKERVSKTNTFRDYDKYPLKFREMIPEEDLYELYINQNLLTEEIAELLNIPRYTVKRCLRQYKMNKPKELLDKMNREKSLEELCYLIALLKNPDTPLPKNLVKRSEKRKHITKKCFDTKKENKSIHLSKPEKFILDVLSTRFKDIVIQEPSELYPYHCDFYLPELDMYIEYQGHASHGRRPFNIKSNDDLLQVSEWIKKVRAYPGYKCSYRSYLKVWLLKDRIKRNTAKRNNLNFKEYFRMEDFIKWFNKVKDYKTVEQYDKLIDMMSVWLFRLD